MSGIAYYIDPQEGSDGNDGLSPASPLKTYANRTFSSGDRVLFKRGTVLRESLVTCCGSEEGVVTYGAYGDGDKPAFLGSEAANNANDWTMVTPSVWQYTKPFSNEVCNLIFNQGSACGHLRWELADLHHQGEWFCTGSGKNTERETTGAPHDFSEDRLYLYSSANPCLIYSSIECALWGKRRLAGGQQYIHFENLCFRYAGVHGFQESHAHHIRITSCDFFYIGGAVWSKQRRIRLGNAIEFWDGAEQITVEKCLFMNIYDAGITHQGGPQSTLPSQIYCQNNLFVNCGLAAYEYRGPAASEVYFEYNTCIDNGGGFALQGQPPPRNSEFYPHPAGHHVFVWRTDKSTQTGPVYIRHNVFGNEPYGGAVYSIIDPVDESKFILDYNVYQINAGPLLTRWKGKDYLHSQFAQYQAESGQDKHSQCLDFQLSGYDGPYHLPADFPVRDVGADLEQ